MDLTNATIKKYIELSQSFDETTGKTTVSMLEFYIGFDTVDAGGIPENPQIKFKAGQPVEEVVDGTLTTEELLAFAESIVEPGYAFNLAVPYAAK